MADLTPLWISFFTEDYARWADNMIASLENWGLKYAVSKVKDRGPWVSNCAYKPEFIWQKMSENPGRPLVWIDADADVIRNPVLFHAPGPGADVAVCRYSWKSRPRRTETFSGTIWFSGKPGSVRLVDRWIELQRTAPEAWDQKTLDEALETVPGLRVFWLPVSYCWIYDMHPAEEPDGEPVIVHHQASRARRGKRAAPTT